MNTIKKTVLGLITTILLLSIALPVYAEVEIQRSTCEMTINSAKHTFSSPSNATGDCNGLVFGFYNSNQDTFAVTGMIDYDFNASVKEFIVATPAGKHAEAVLTVYTVKEAPKPQPKPEEPKEESKPTPVEKPKEEPKKETKPTQPKEEPKQESKPTVQKPKEETKSNTSTQKPKANNPKTSTSQKDTVTSNQSNSSENNAQTEKEQNSDSTEVASNTNDEDKGKEDLEEETENKEQEDLEEEQPKISDSLEKDGTSISRVWGETEKIKLASYDTENDSETTGNGLFVYLGIGVVIIILGGLGWWFYKKRKVS